MDLRFDRARERSFTPRELLERLIRAGSFFDGAREQAARGRNADGGEELLGVVFVEFHCNALEA